MAISVTTLEDTTYYRLIDVHVTSPDVTNSVIYDFSADTNTNGDATSGRIIECWAFGHNNCDGELLWDGTPIVTNIHIPKATATHLDFRSIRGLKNHASSPTGDLLITTTGLTGAEHIHAIILLGKHYTSKLMLPGIGY